MPSKYFLFSFLRAFFLQSFSSFCCAGDPEKTKAPPKPLFLSIHHLQGTHQVVFLGGGSCPLGFLLLPCPLPMNSGAGPPLGEGETRVFIGRLPDNADRTELESIFSQYGPIKWAPPLPFILFFLSVFFSLQPVVAFSWHCSLVGAGAGRLATETLPLSSTTITTPQRWL